VIYDNMREVLA